MKIDRPKRKHSPQQQCLRAQMDIITGIQTGGNLFIAYLYIVNALAQGISKCLEWVDTKVWWCSSQIFWHEYLKTKIFKISTYFAQLFLGWTRMHPPRISILYDSFKRWELTARWRIASPPVLWFPLPTMTLSNLLSSGKSFKSSISFNLDHQDEGL